MIRSKVSGSVPALHFGWGSPQHSALEAGARDLLPETPLKTFLNEHLDAVNHHSIRQDLECRGSHHAFNLERLGTDRFGTKPERPKNKTVLDTFGAGRYETTRQTLEKTLLGEHPDIDSQPNVHRQIRQEYDALVGLFQQISDKPPRFFPGKMKLARQLESRLGSLMHYVGDLHQPMHATDKYSWTLEQSITPQGEQTLADAHLYLETILLNSPEELQQWRESLKTTELPDALNKQSLSGLLDRQIRKSHLAMFTLVAADRGARHHAPAQEYYTALKHRFTAAAEAQLSEAAAVMAHILHSAWLAGEQPDLVRLNVSSTTEKAVRKLDRMLNRPTGRLRSLLPPGPPDISRRP